MSLKNFVSLPVVAEALDRLIPGQQILRMPDVLRAPPITGNYTLIGTAFDYALRIELERRFPNAQTREWVAGNGVGSAPEGIDEIEFFIKTEAIYDDAVQFYKKFKRNKVPSAVDYDHLARHSIQLARLETGARGFPDVHIGEHDPGDIHDIKQLLDIAPCEILGNSQTLLLNPIFGDASNAVGGADADIISSDRLIDIKVTKNSEVKKEYLRQLLGYYILG